LALLTTPSVLDRIRAGSKKAVQDKLVLSELRKLSVILPPLEEQGRFAVIVKSIEQQNGKFQIHLSELNTLFASLQSRAFLGEL
jgi:type I restriction enzyme S subunit